MIFFLLHFVNRPTVCEQLSGLCLLYETDKMSLDVLMLTTGTGEEAGCGKAYKKDACVTDVLIIP